MAPYDRQELLPRAGLDYLGKPELVAYHSFSSKKHPADRKVLSDDYRRCDIKPVDLAAPSSNMGCVAILPYGD